MAQAFNLKAKVTLDLRMLERLRDEPEAALRALDAPIQASARLVLDFALFLVPRGGAPDDPVNLADTAFLSGPIYNFERKSTTWLCGFDHHAAIPINANIHWGHELGPPLEFMRRAAKASGAKRRARVGVEKAIQQFITKYATESHT